RLQEDAASLGDAVDTDIEPIRLLEHGVEAARPLRARDLDPVLRAVREALVRVGQLVQVAGREADRAEEVARRGHAAANLSRAVREKPSVISPARIRSSISGSSTSASESV